MTQSRTILIAGAGIAGLVTGLALVRRGFRVLICEQAEQLRELGAGIQLSPNATKVLFKLGLRESLERVAVAAEGVRVIASRTGRELTSATLGPSAAARFGAPYWLVHRGDLQRELISAARARPEMSFRLGAKVEDFVTHVRGVTVLVRGAAGLAEENGVALVGADGAFSTLRERAFAVKVGRFAGLTAWRALVPAGLVLPEQRRPFVNLWLGPGAHLVHYPVRDGKLVNIVVTLEQQTAFTGGVQEAADELGSRLAEWAWGARQLFAAAAGLWSTWALYEYPSLRQWNHGEFTLVGDAAHPIMPFLAQGGAMAIEDAWVLANCLGDTPETPTLAFDRYWRLRRHRTARVSRHARTNGRIFHLRGPAALARDLVLRMRGKRLLDRYDWLYEWDAPTTA